jgi:hypothetical protein
MNMHIAALGHFQWHVLVKETMILRVPYMSGVFCPALLPSTSQQLHFFHRQKQLTSFQLVMQQQLFDPLMHPSHL